MPVSMENEWENNDKAGLGGAEESQPVLKLQETDCIHLFSPARNCPALFLLKKHNESQLFISCQCELLQK